MIAQRVTFEQVRRVTSAAAREHVAITDSKAGDEWWAVLDGRDVLACGALHRGRRIKATWTDPAHRGLGYGRQIIVELVTAAGHGEVLEVIANRPAWWIRHGWSPVRVHRFGGTVLRCGQPAAAQSLLYSQGSGQTGPHAEGEQQNGSVNGTV